jgi:hypothetical protein
LSNPDELVILMILPVGIDELIIPGVLVSRNIPVHVTERYLAVEVDMQRFEFRLRA